MNKCPHCGKQVNSKMKFCPYCGFKLAKFKPMTHCPNCGAKITPEEKFCTNCGYDLKKVTSKGLHNYNNNKQHEHHINNQYQDYRSNNTSDNVRYTNDVHPGQRYANIKKTRDSNSVWIKKNFSASALLFWIGGTISVDYRAVHIHAKNTVLGIFPAGDDIQDIPLQYVTTSHINTCYKVFRMICGALLAIGGLECLSNEFFLGLILLILGAALFCNGIITQLIIEKMGSSYTLDVPFFDKKNIQLVKSVINQASDTEEDKHDISLYHNKIR